jgi:hypothetical protein
MNQFMTDSCRTDIDPRELTLDYAMQARDVELIKNKRLRSAQEYKQASQDNEILDDLRDGLPIRLAITVFVVGDVHYVVDGFHRTDACLKYLKETPDADITIPALVIKNRTYREAVAAAQDANQSHGVGVTADEVMQSKFRKLIVEGKFNLSVSAVMKEVECSKGQAAHIAKGLKACGKAFTNPVDVEFTDLAVYVDKLQDGLQNQFYCPDSTWDSKGFPKIRRLSDIASGKEFTGFDMDDDAWEQVQIETATKDFGRLIERYGDDCFREALRKYVKGTGLGVSITKRNNWLEQAGSIKGDEVPQGWDGTVVPVIDNDF